MDEDEKLWFERIYWAIKDIDDTLEPGSHTMAGGFWSMPPVMKRKWLAWVQLRAEAGDERYIRIFTRLMKDRLLE